MASKSRDLWPDKIAATELRPPVVILREQAALLGQKTNGLVIAEVTTVTGDKGKIVHFFHLVAPALDHYRYELFWVVHDVTLYPVEVCFAGSKNSDVPSEEEFLDTLKGVFSSEMTVRIVHSLVAQSRST